MESPVIVKNSFGSKFNIKSRVASQTQQSISNSEAFDVVYNGHKDYYSDKITTTVDPNYNKMEKYLLNEFKHALDSNLKYDSHLNEAWDIEKTHSNNHIIVNTKNSPKISMESVQGQVHNHAGAHISKTNPYNEIYPNN